MDDTERSQEELVAEIEELRREHREFDEQLAELQRHVYLSLEEQIEEARLKKGKLQRKDRIFLLQALLTKKTAAS